MKKIVIIFILYIISFCYADDGRMAKYHRRYTIDMTTTKKIAEIDLYPTEKKVKNYVSFLLSEKSLSIDYSIEYSVAISDENEKWLVLLFETESSPENVVIDTFDYPVKYAFYVCKRDGKLTDLSKIN